MKFMSIRDLPNDSCEIKRIVEEGSVVLTANGKPFALLVSLDEDADPVEMDRLIRKARAEWAISRIRNGAERFGLDQMSLDDIDAEIAAARAERKR